MIWGRTKEQEREFLARWRRKFAFLPTWLDCGRTIWLGFYEERERTIPVDGVRLSYQSVERRLRPLTFGLERPDPWPPPPPETPS